MVRLLPPALAALTVAGLASAKQVVLSSADTRSSPSSSLSHEYHTTFKHPSYPAHALRVKETTGWCDPDVRSFTGYIDVDGFGQSLFFYYFEAREKDAQDVVGWWNGGPGASSAMGLFLENGPCGIDLQTGNLTYREESWNQRASVIFLDSPAEVGFSYSKGGQPLHSTSEGAAVDIQAFLSIFFEAFELQGRPFHMTGESYGGRYLPVFASAVFDGNEFAAAQNRTPIDLKSVAIGNGWVDSQTMYEGYYDQMCTAVSGVGPIQSVSECAFLQEALPRCTKSFQAACRDVFDPLSCGQAVDFCSQLTNLAFHDITPPRNWYNIEEICASGECSTDKQSKVLADYLNRPDVQKLLGVDPEWEGPWGKDRGISAAFGAIFGYGTMDVQHQTSLYVTALLEHGVRVLLYAGDVDFACNAPGMRRMAEKLEWSGAEAYRNASFEPWYVEGSTKRAGQVKTGGEGLLYFATVHGAGHLVPTDKPVEALSMINRWWANEPL